MLRRGAAGARVRCRRDAGRALGRPGRGLRVARLESRHHRRPQGQRLDRRQRRRRRARAEVHARRQVPAQFGKAGVRVGAGRRSTGKPDLRRRQQRRADLRPRRRRSSSIERQRGLYRRRLPEQARRGRSTPTRGKLKRYWGAYGNKPDDTDLGPYNPDAPPAQQFRNPVHCADLSNDGLVYVCDRVNNRLQVFRTDGTFVKEAFMREEQPRRRRGVGRRVLEGSAADVSSTSPTAAT